MAVAPGYKIWQYFTPVTVAASPLVGPWLDTTGYTQVFCWGAFAGGTSTVTVEGGFDGSTVDADAVYAVTNTTFTTPAAFSVITPFIRVRLVQTVGDATKTKMFLQARA